MPDPDLRRVVQLVYPGVTLLDVTGPSQVFGNAGNIGADGSLSAGPTQYEVKVVSQHGGSVMTDTGVALATCAIGDVDLSDIDTLLVSGGTGVLDALKEPELIEWYRTAAATSRRFGSTCMGAFLLAESGLADGRRVATHWRWADELGRRYPQVQVDARQIFVTEDRMWTSAGVTSGIDMTLAMIAEDLGHKISIELAKAILVDFRRPGNQQQYSSRLQAQLADEEGRFDALHAWMMDNLRANLSADALAEQQGMSVRNFARLYKEATGMTPAKSVERMRVEVAKNLLVRDGMRGSAVARAVGFGTDMSMRRAFMRVIDMTPSDFQRRYQRRAIAAE